MRLVAVAVCWACGAGASSAEAWWSTAPALETSAQDQPAIALGVGDDGTTAVAWPQEASGGRTQLMAAIKRPGQSDFGPAQELAADLADHPDVAVGPDGRVLVAWNSRSVGLETAEAPPAGRFATMHLAASNSNAVLPSAHLDRAGDATVFYVGDGGGLVAATSPSGGTTWTTRSVTGSDETGSARPVAGVAANGDALATFLTRSAQGVPVTNATLRASVAGAFAPAIREEGTPSQVVTGPDGRLALTVLDQQPRLLVREPGGQLEPVVLPDDAVDTVTVSYVGDDLRLVESRWDGERVHVIVRVRHAGAWGPAQTLADPDGAQTAPQVVSSPRGALMALWSGTDPMTGEPALVSETRNADGTWPGRQAINRAPFQGRFTIATSAGGSAAVGWTWWDGSAWQISVAQPDDAPDPVTPIMLRPARPTLPPGQGASTGYQVDPAHTGRLVGAGVGATLTPAWSARTGGGNDYAVIAADEVAATYHDENGAGGVVTYDLATGAERWRQPWSAGVADTQLATDGARLYLAKGDEVVAYALTDGHELWRTTVSQYAPETLFAHDGRVYLDASGFGNSAFLLDAATGQLVWRSPYGANTMTEVGDELISTGACGVAKAWKRASGDPAWRHVTGCSGGGSSTGAFDGGWLWAEDDGSPGWIYDTASHQPLARFPGTAPAFSRASAVNIEDGELVARDNQTLREVWRFAADGNLRTNPLIADSTVLVASQNGVLYAVDLATGRLTWSGSTGPTSFFSSRSGLAGLAAANGHVVVPTSGGIQVFRSTSPAVADPGAASVAPDQPAAQTTSGGTAGPVTTTTATNLATTTSPGAPHPHPSSAHPVVASLPAPPRRWALSAAAHGLSVRVHCAAGCTLQALMTLSPATARRKHAPVTIASGTVRRSSAGDGLLRLHAGPQARKALARLRGATATLTVVLKGPSPTTVAVARVALTR